MAAQRVLVLRHTAPTVRIGAGLANGRTVNPRCDPGTADRSANSGISVMPWPRHHHLPQGLERCRAKILVLAHTGRGCTPRALIAKAMPILEQQQRLVPEVLYP